MRWDAKEIAGFLDRLWEKGGYASERQMALDLGEHQETVNGWRRAKRRPSLMEAFLHRYAEKHRLNAAALVEHWEFESAEVQGPPSKLPGWIMETRAMLDAIYAGGNEESQKTVEVLLKILLPPKIRRGARGGDPARRSGRAAQ